MPALVTRRVRRSFGRFAVVIALAGGLSIGGCLWLRPSPVELMYRYTGLTDLPSKMTMSHPANLSSAPQ